MPIIQDRFCQARFLDSKVFVSSMRAVGQGILVRLMEEALIGLKVRGFLAALSFWRQSLPRHEPLPGSRTIE
jgi:hypothetical protein